jgi:hypothetical protein
MKGYKKVALLKKDYPVNAVDFDQTSIMGRFVLLSAVRILNAINTITTGQISQTVIFKLA